MNRAPVTMPSASGAESSVDAFSLGEEPSEVTRFLSPGEAQRLTQHIKLTASGVRNGLFKLSNLIEEAKRSNAWQILGFASWTAYLSDALSEEPMRLPREKRLELVALLAGEGLSTRAIAPIVGVSREQVRRDTNVPPETPVEIPTTVPAVSPGAVAAPVEDALDAATINPDTGEVTDGPVITEHTLTEKTKTIVGLDGKTYQKKEPKPVPRGDAAAKLNAETESKALGAALSTLLAMRTDAHRTRVITEWWPAGNDAVPPDSRALFEPHAIRDIATWLLRLADELEGTS